MAGDGTRDLWSGANGMKRVFPAIRACRKFAVSQIWQQVAGFRRGAVWFSIFQRPLVYGGVNLAKIVNAGITVFLRRGVVCGQGRLRGGQGRLRVGLGEITNRANTQGQSDDCYADDDRRFYFCPCHKFQGSFDEG